MTQDSSGQDQDATATAVTSLAVLLEATKEESAKLLKIESKLLAELAAAEARAVAAEAAANVAVAPVSTAQASSLQVPPFSRPADDCAVAAEAELLRKWIAELEQC